MRIHVSRNVSADAIHDAIRAAGAHAEVLSEHGSRKRDHAFEVKLTGNSNRRPNGGTYGARDAYAATWDQWGVFINAVFDADPDATMTYYTDAADFHYRTGARFAEGWPADAHGDHTFRYIVGRGISCTKCSATQRNI